MWLNSGARTKLSRLTVCALRPKRPTKPESTLTLSAYSIAVEVVRVMTARDLLIRNLRNKSHAKERNWISRRTQIGLGVGRIPLDLQRELTLDAVLAARDHRVGEQLVPDQKKISVVASTATKDGLFMASPARRQVVLRTQARFRCEPTKCDLTASLEAV